MLTVNLNRMLNTESLFQTQAERVEAFLIFRASITRFPLNEFFYKICAKLLFNKLQN